uniref:Uncharacterized protein n=1 Tax=Arundo donax TaxID=35708 RepID=A0A0A9EIT7_ARUDO
MLTVTASDSQSYFHIQTHIYTSRGKNDWHWQTRKHQIPRVTTEMEERKAALICD